MPGPGLARPPTTIRSRPDHSWACPEHEVGVSSADPPDSAVSSPRGWGGERLPRVSSLVDATAPSATSQRVVGEAPARLRHSTSSPTSRPLGGGAQPLAQPPVCSRSRTDSAIARTATVRRTGQAGDAFRIRRFRSRSGSHPGRPALSGARDSTRVSRCGGVDQDQCRGRSSSGVWRFGP